MPTRIQIRRGTAAEWTAENPILADGEAGLETDTLKVKYGDGTTDWTSLAYATGGDIQIANVTGLQTALDGKATPSQITAAVLPLQPQFANSLNLPGEYKAPVRIPLTIGVDNVVYTCPAGRKAVIAESAILNTAATTITAKEKIDTGGTVVPLYYFAAPVTSMFTGLSNPPVILMPGESLLLNPDSAGASILLTVFEIDESIPITAHTLQITTVPTAIYTVPVNKEAVLVHPAFGRYASNVNPSIWAQNESASSAVWSGYYTPNGQVFDIANDRIFVRPATNAGNSGVVYPPIRMNGGDSFLLGSSINDAGQWTRVHYYEYDV